MANRKLMFGDSAIRIKELKDNSIHSIVTDPPYGLSFMGKDWDKTLPPTEIWQECFRVLKPGGYIITMSASRTYHRLAVQLEDLGFITHPMIGWIFGSGFPKATDLSKQFDKGIEREVMGEKYKVGDHSKAIDNYGFKESGGTSSLMNNKAKSVMETIPSTDLAKKWDGWKYGLQSLKPALEPIYIGQKPWKNKYIKRMTENVEKYGVGAMNIDACRVSFDKDFGKGGGSRIGSGNSVNHNPTSIKTNGKVYAQNSQGRHPANLLHDGSESVEKEFLEQSRWIHSAGKKRNAKRKCASKGMFGMPGDGHRMGDSGLASRFFNSLPITELDAPFNYIAKASKRERNEGLKGFEEKERNTTTGATRPNKPARIGANPQQKTEKQQNHHPTVKPIALFSWLVKLVTPKDGTCLDPFMGSGTTGIACKKNKFNFIGIEKEKDY